MDCENAIVLIGAGATPKDMGKIVKVSTSADMLKAYGKCPLTDAYTEAAILGAPEIYVINVRRPQDYPAAVRSLSHYDAGFICPVDVYMDGTVDLASGRWLWPRLMLDSSGAHSLATFIMTMPHVDLYEDAQSAMAAAKNAVNSFWNLSGATWGQNLIFTLNNLKEFRHANVALAAAWCAGSVASYPVADFGESMYTYDLWDTDNKEVAFFRSWRTRPTTIENLVNFRSEAGPLKSGHIDRIIKHIYRTLDFSEFIGKPATEYIRFKIENKLLGYLELWMEDLIDAYEITNIEWDESGEVGTRILRCSYWILPRLSQEKISLKLEV